MIEKYPFAARKPHQLLYNWFDATELVDCPSHRFEQPTILHGGSLYGGTRRMQACLQALGRLRQETRHDGAVHLVQYSVSGDSTRLEDKAGEHGVADLVQVRSALPRDEFLRACRGADILLVVVGRNQGRADHANAIPAKIFDYFSACRPILVVGPRGCEAGKLVKRLNRGLFAPDDSPERIADAIRHLMVSEGSSGPLDLSLQAVSEFEASSALANLAAFLRRALG